jgi:hypothetical protein
MIVGFSASIGTILGDAIVATIGKLGDLVAALPEIALHGSEVADLADNYNRLTAQAGLLGDTLLGTLRAGTHGTVDDFVLMQRVNKDLAAGLDLTEGQFRTLADGAFALANATGVDVTSALDTMNDALLKGKPKALEALVGVVDLKDAEEAYAKSLGGTAKDLTEDAKLYADRKAMLEAVAEATKRLGEQTDGLDEIVAQAQTAWTNFLDELGSAIATSDVLVDAIAGVRDILVEAFGGEQATLIEAIKTLIEDLVLATTEYGSTAAQVIATIGEGWHTFALTIETVYDWFLQAQEASLKFQLSFVNFKAWLAPWSDFSEEIAIVTKQLNENEAEIRANKAAIEGHAQGMVNWVVKGEEAAAKFDALHLKLQQTKDAAKEFVGPVQDVAAAQGAAAEGARKHTQGLVDNTEAMKAATAAAKEEQKILDDLQKSTYNEQQKLTKAMRDEQNKELKERNATVVAGLEQIKDAEGKLRDFEMKQALDSTSYQIVKIWEVAEAQKNAFKGSEEQHARYNAAINALASEQAQDLITKEYEKQDKLTEIAIDAEARRQAGIKAERDRAAADFAASEMFGGVRLAPGSVDLSNITPQNTDPMVLSYLQQGYSMSQALAMAAGHGANVAGSTRAGGINAYAGFAAGGPVDSGVPIVVGERGPEVFVPASGGAIVPNGAGGMVTNIYITQPLGSPQAIADAVGAAQMQAMRTRGERFRPSGV